MSNILLNLIRMYFYKINGYFELNNECTIDFNKWLYVVM